jgi:hypothetical protein
MSKFKERIIRIPRWLLLGLEGHDPDCLFWVARREVFQNVSLSAGMARYLPALVTRHGFRVCEVYVEHQDPVHGLQDVRPNPGDLLAAWWSCRRWRDRRAYELSAGAVSPSILRLIGADDSESYVPSAASENPHREFPLSKQTAINSTLLPQQTKRA